MPSAEKIIKSFLSLKRTVNNKYFDAWSAANSKFVNNTKAAKEKEISEGIKNRKILKINATVNTNTTIATEKPMKTKEVATLYTYNPIKKAITTNSGKTVLTRAEAISFAKKIDRFYLGTQIRAALTGPDAPDAAEMADKAALDEDEEEEEEEEEEGENDEEEEEASAAIVVEITPEQGKKIDIGNALEIFMKKTFGPVKDSDTKIEEEDVPPAADGLGTKMDVEGVPAQTKDAEMVPEETEIQKAAKRRAIWRGIYQRAYRYIPVMRPDGILEEKLEITYPCHHCGMLVIEGLMQVDHYLPRKGGQDASILKTLRMLRLTEDHPTGGKNTLLGEGEWNDIVPTVPTPTTDPAGAPEGNFIAITGPVSDKTLLMPKDRPSGDFTHYIPKAPEDDTEKAPPIKVPSDKWTTTDAGSAFLSMFCSDAKHWSSLRTLCLNSVLNLVPLCTYCNGKKTNKMKQGLDKPVPLKNNSAKKMTGLKKVMVSPSPSAPPLNK